MKLRILSDLHLEFSEWTPPKVDCDVVILAGDIHVGARALPWIEKHFQGQTVIYIRGNHEGYGHDLAKVHAELQAYANAEPPLVDLRYLDNEWTLINKYEPIAEAAGDTLTHSRESIWFFGGTLWTDFALDGNPELAMRIARQCMNDYRRITLNGARLTPDDTVAQHAEFLERLDDGLTGAPEHGMGKTVVVGHHLPSRQSIDNDYRSSDVNPAYASNLEAYMLGEHAPVLWVHGHTHRSKDYVCGRTRVVCNPRGYSASPTGFENMGFQGDLVVEV